MARKPPKVRTTVRRGNVIAITTYASEDERKWMERMVQKMRAQGKKSNLTLVAREALNRWRQAEPLQESRDTLSRESGDESEESGSHAGT